MSDAPRQIVYVPVDEIVPALRNPRRHENIEDVKASIRDSGFVESAVHDGRTGRILAGHGRTKALAEMAAAGEDAPEGIVAHVDGRWTMPVTYGWSSRDDDEAERMVLWLNRASESSGWVEPDLLAILQDLQTRDRGLVGTGFDDLGVADLLRRTAPPSQPRTGVDEAPPLPEEPMSQAGQIWELGPHRLLIGDATDPASYDRLLTQRVRLVWTDPPYGIDYVGKTGSALTIRNDDLAVADLEMLLRAAFAQAVAWSEPGAAWYVAAPSVPPASVAFYRALADLKVWRQTLVWVKDRFVLGRSDYHWRHEDILYGATPGSPPPDVPLLAPFEPPEPSPEYEGLHEPIVFGWSPGAPTSVSPTAARTPSGSSTARLPAGTIPR